MSANRAIPLEGSTSDSSPIWDIVGEADTAEAKISEGTNYCSIVLRLVELLASAVSEPKISQQLADGNMPYLVSRPT